MTVSGWLIGVGYACLQYWLHVHSDHPELISTFHQPAQQESCLTSLLKVWAQSFNPSTIVR